MNTINDLFNAYGWKQIKSTNSHSTYIKNNKYRLEEFIIEPNEDKTFNITIPLLNSDYLYKNTISTLEETHTYIEMHLQGR